MIQYAISKFGGVAQI